LAVDNGHDRKADCWTRSMIVLDDGADGRSACRCVAALSWAPVDASQLSRCRRWLRRFMWTIEASITRAAAMLTTLCCWCCVSTMIVKR